METDRDTDKKQLPPDDEEEIAAAAEEEDWDDEEEGWNDQPEEPSPAPVRPHARPDAGAVGCLVLVLALVLLFGWLIVSAIVDVMKEDREAELRRWQNRYSYQDTKRSSSGNSSYSGSSSYGSSGGSRKSGSTGGGSRKDEYNAADFGNAEDFYDEHYDDFFDYYDAEDYWNEYN